VPTTPDADLFEIVDIIDIGQHMVMKVKYPNCSNCAYEGQKIMVFLNVNWKDVIKWRKIDPHFRAPNSIRRATEAPSPAARFPGSPSGWNDAVAYARGKVKDHNEE
jgi:hypothetical protein